MQAAEAEWPGWLPSRLVNLGLDLRGGAYVLVEVDTDEVYAERLESFWPTLRDKLRDLRDTVGTVRRLDTPDALRVRIGNPAGMEAALQAVHDAAAPVFSITGGSSREFQAAAEGDTLVVTLSDAEKVASAERTMQQSLEIIRRRVDESGTREPSIQRQGADRILVQVPGVGSAEELLQIIGTTARLSFHAVVSRSTDPNVRPGLDEMVAASEDEPGVFYVLERRSVVTGEQLDDSQPSFDQNGRPAVTFRFNPSGGAAFGAYTAENIGKPFAIVLDDKVISAPTIQSHIAGGLGDHHRQLHAGGVDAPRGAAPRRRAAGRDQGDRAADDRAGARPELDQRRRHLAVVAFVAVIAFMIASYGLFGLIRDPRARRERRCSSSRR